MNRYQNLLKPLALTLAIGFTTVLLGCSGGGGGGSGGSSKGNVSFLAGSMGGDGYLDGTGSQAGFSHPSAMTTDSAGNMYVADNQNCTIRKVTPAGVVTTLAGTVDVCGNVDGTGAAANFDRPHGLATDDTNLYVADKNNDTIRKIVIATRVVTTIAGTGSSGYTDDPTGTNASFNTPMGLALNTAHTLLYVADKGNCVVRQIDLSTTAVTTLAGDGSCGYLDDPTTPTNAEFNAPFGLATDSADNIYVSDRWNHVIREISSGAVTTLAGSQFPANGGGPGEAATDGAPGTAQLRNPSGIATDGSGHLYVGDKKNGLLRVVDTSNGNLSTVAGSYSTSGSDDGTGAAASFTKLGGVALTTDSTGNVYVPDTRNHAIRMITPAGVVTTFAGDKKVQGNADGTGAAATFMHTKGVAVDSAGNLFVADGWDNSIREIDTAGAVTTFVSGNGLSSPLGLAIDSADNIYVANKSGSNVLMITPGAVVSTLASGFSSPHDLALDSAGNVYVADNSGNISKLDATNSYAVSTYASGVSGAHGLAFDSAGNLYAAEGNRNGNNVIDKIDASTQAVTVLAGSGSIGSDNGTGATASFDDPHGMVIDSAGNLYVADRRNNTIRKITHAGKVTTVAGVAGERDFKAGKPGILPAPRFLAIKGKTLYVSARHGVLKVALP